MARVSRAGDYPYRKKTNATGSRLHNSDRGENTDVARAIAKFPLNISEPILDPTTTKSYAFQIDDAKVAGPVDVAQWAGIARQRDLWTQELRSQGVVSPDFLPVVDAGMNAVIWNLLNLMPINNVVGYAINIYTQNPDIVDEIPAFGVNYTVADYKHQNSINSGEYPTPFHLVPDGFPPWQPGFLDIWADSDYIGYFSIAVPVQGGGTPSNQPSPQQLAQVAIDFAEIAALATLPELIAPELIAGELVGTEAPFIFGPLTASPVELPLIGSPLIALPPANVRMFIGDSTDSITPVISRVFNNNNSEAFNAESNTGGKRFLGYMTDFTLPNSVAPIIDQPPFIPDVPNCCGQWIVDPVTGQPVYPVIGGGGVVTIPGPYQPVPPVPTPKPPAGTPIEPPTNPNPNRPTDTLFTCVNVYTNNGNTIAPNLTQVVEDLVNIGGGIQNALNNIASSLTPPFNVNCDTVQAVIIAVDTERLIDANGWPNLNDSIFSRKTTFLKAEGGKLVYSFEPVPDGTNTYNNIPTIGFHSTDETYLPADKYLMPVDGYADIANIIVDSSAVQVDNTNHPGFKVNLCGIRTLPSDTGLPIRLYTETVPVGVSSANAIGARNAFGSFYYTMQSNGVLVANDYSSSLNATAPICSKGTRTSVVLNIARKFIGGNAHTHTYTGNHVFILALRDSSGNEFSPLRRVTITTDNAEEMFETITFDASSLDFTGVASLAINVNNCDEGQNAGPVALYYINASWV